ncbi:hypothetical protein GUJ93_ZPchr0006g41385 [Zizania palustris]|uniref:Uncharacterized protein n=1 Tax=Zizania palustris TaxID=103762 RepID=A0A8J5SZ72_ZIZPA|nr:hypothetical protein GUJ93_ZPchr0006g41385 [Zizania palustris]
MRPNLSRRRDGESAADKPVSKDNTCRAGRSTLGRARGVWRRGVCARGARPYDASVRGGGAHAQLERSKLAISPAAPARGPRLAGCRHETDPTYVRWRPTGE